MHDWMDQHLLRVCEWLHANDDDIGRKILLHEIQSADTMHLLLSSVDFRNSLLLSMDMDQSFPAIVIADELKKEMNIGY